MKKFLVFLFCISSFCLLRADILSSAADGNVREVKLYIAMGGDVNRKNAEGITALIAASAYGHTECVKVLLDAHADVNAKDKDGDTALVWAANSGKPQVVKILLDAGADFTSTNNKGKDVLSFKMDDQSRQYITDAFNALETETKKKSTTSIGCAHKTLTFALPNENQLDMIRCPAGSYTMGCSPNSPEAQFSVKQRTETFVQDYYLGKYEITQAQYEAVMGCNPSYFKAPDKPVEQVTSTDAETFCKKLNALLAKNLPDGYIFTLPTEAEWEWAAYGCDPQKPFIYSGSNDYNEVAWNMRNSSGLTHHVAEKKPNQLGFFDLSGNVFERCYGNDKDRANHKPANSCRGGAWGGHEIFCRPAANAGEDKAVYHVGFRVALVPADKITSKMSSK